MIETAAVTAVFMTILGGMALFLMKGYFTGKDQRIQALEEGLQSEVKARKSAIVEVKNDVNHVQTEAGKRREKLYEKLEGLAERTVTHREIDRIFETLRKIENKLDNAIQRSQVDGHGN